MKVGFIYPGDKIKLSKDASITATQKLLKAQSKLDDPQQFILSLSHLPPGTVLEVSQLYIKERNHPENSITFKVSEGALFPEYNKYSFKNEQAEFETRMASLEKEIKEQNNPTVKKELTYSLSNLKRRYDKLLKANKKTGFTKLLRFALTDIETWEANIK